MGSMGGSTLGSMDSVGSACSAGGGGGFAGAHHRHHSHPVVEAVQNLMAASAQPVEFADLDMGATMAGITAQVRCAAGDLSACLSSPVSKGMLHCWWWSECKFPAPGAHWRDA
jgi:hypothetical protein